MTKITVQATIKASVEEVWKKWTSPEHMVNWNFASNDWHSPSAENDLRKGGKFKVRMEAKDGSEGFDLEGVYISVEEYELIEYKMADNRTVRIEFQQFEDDSIVIETFDAENTYSIELQQQGWQAILNNFKSYCEV